jgi:hypothetical protein
MRNSPPPDRKLALDPVHVDTLRAWRSFARAHREPRPASSGPQSPPPGLLSAVLTPIFTSCWMGTQDPALLLAPPANMAVEEQRGAKLDPSQPLTVELRMLGTASWQGDCSQGTHAVGRVTWTWLA